MFMLELPCGVFRRLYLSRNRFAEVPEAACHLTSLEGLCLYHNCLRSITPAIANLQALTYLNLSRNQLTSLPACLCRLPLKILIASNNKLASLPDDIGALSNLRQLDVGSNELQSLPASIGGLMSLRDLSVRRNQIDSLPEELAELPLVRLDFSCNRVAHIPVCYRHLRYLQCILLENNPLQFPPAQVCSKGRVHIFKYLHLEACSRARLDLEEFARGSRPTGFGTCLLEEFYPTRQYGGLDSGFNSVDSGSKRWSGNESADEFSDLSFRIAELARDPRQLKEKRNGAADASDLEQIDYIDSSINGDEEEEELQKPPKKSSFQRAGAADQSPSGRASGVGCSCRPEPTGEERRRPELLQLWQERERQQQQLSRGALWGQGREKQDSGLAENSSSLSQLKHRSQAAEQLTGCPRQALHPGDLAQLQGSVATCPSSREPGFAKPPSFLFRSSSRNGIQRGSGFWPEPYHAEPTHSPRLRAGPQALDERELAAALRMAIESHLKTTLASRTLGGGATTGCLLCQLDQPHSMRSVPLRPIALPGCAKAERHQKSEERGEFPAGLSPTGDSRGLSLLRLRRHPRQHPRLAPPPPRTAGFCSGGGSGPFACRPPVGALGRLWRLLRLSHAAAVPRLSQALWLLVGQGGPGLWPWALRAA
uniref:Uncharacterized protein n=1 Tax=Sphaerodactylus townsendi TaxID=933632 RepID=A0ACB8EXF5_9SAUR